MYSLVASASRMKRATSARAIDRKRGYDDHSTVHRLFQDDLPSVSISPLRTACVVTADMEWVVVAFGEGDSALKRRVGVTHLSFRNGGGWSFFVCPVCGSRARILKLHERPMCRRCLLRRGIPYRIAGGSPAERAEAR